MTRLGADVLINISNGLVSAYELNQSYENYKSVSYFPKSSI